MTEQPTPKPKRLSKKERLFAEFVGRGTSGAEAARQAGYSERSARQIAHRLLTKAYILAEVERIQESLIMAAPEIGRRLTDQAQGDMSDFIRVNLDGTFQIDLTKAKEQGKLRLIKKAKFIDSPKLGKSWEIELYDAHAALVDLAKIRGMLRDSNLNIDVAQLSTAQLERIAKGEDVLKVISSKQEQRSSD